MPESVLFHEGNRQLQGRFGSRRIANRLGDELNRSEFTEEDRRSIQGLPYFFLVTADAEGRRDCSFKGGRPASCG